MEDDNANETGDEKQVSVAIQLCSLCLSTKRTTILYSSGSVVWTLKYSAVRYIAGLGIIEPLDCSVDNGMNGDREWRDAIPCESGYTF